MTTQTLTRTKFTAGDRIQYSDGTTGTIESVGINGYVLAKPDQGKKSWINESLIRKADEAIAPPTELAPAGPQAAQIYELAAAANQAIADVEEALQTSALAEQAAIANARRVGDILLQAKALVKSQKLGNWEAWRDKHIQGRDGKPLPSSTATAYQRIAKNWELVQDAPSLRAAIEAVKSPRALSAAAVAEVPEGINPSDENYTPADLIEAARRVMGGIDLDPASCALANETVKATCWFGIDEDGLTQPWSGRVWLNPPYSQPAIAGFVQRVKEEWREKRIKAAIVLTNNSTDSSWHQALSEACTVRLDCNSRYQFHNPYRDYGGGNRQGQTLFYFGHDPAAFYREFEGCGLFIPAAPAKQLTPAPVENSPFHDSYMAECEQLIAPAPQPIAAPAPAGQGKDATRVQLAIAPLAPPEPVQLSVDVAIGALVQKHGARAIARFLLDHATPAERQQIQEMLREKEG